MDLKDHYVTWTSFFCVSTLIWIQLHVLHGKAYIYFFFFKVLAILGEFAAWKVSKIIQHLLNIKNISYFSKSSN